MWGYWFRRKNEFALSDVFFLWKVLDFVEGNILVWRADIDSVKIFLVPDLTESRGPAPPLIARGI